MPRPKWTLNTIYISERLQERLRPISRCALTTVVAPMGYGKTTAVNWYLAERAKAEDAAIVRISVYSDHLAIFWKSVQDAFKHAGIPLLRGYACPDDAAGASLLADDLCHGLAGRGRVYIFIDDFHLLTDGRITEFLCALVNRLPENVHLIVASRDRFLPGDAVMRLGSRVYPIGAEHLRLNHTELSIYAHRCGTDLTDAQVETLLHASEGWFSAVYLNLRTLSEHGALPDAERDNLLGECDLIMSFLQYNDIAAMSRLHRSAAARMTRPAISIRNEGSWTFGSPSVLMMFHRTPGQLDAELDAMNACMPHYYRLTNGHGQGAERIMDAEAALLRGRFADAAIFLERARAAIAGNGQENMALCCDFLERRLALCAGTASPEPPAQKRAALLAQHDTMWLRIFDSACAYCAALTGQVGQVPALFREHALHTVHFLAPCRPMMEMIENQVYLAEGAYARVIGRSEGLLAQCAQQHYALVALHVRIQTAAAYAALGKRPEARSLLGQALREAEPDGLLLPFAENGRGLRPLLAGGAWEADLGDFPQRAARCIADYEARCAALCAPGGGPAALAGLTGREREIAALIAARLTNGEIARRLFLSDGSVKQYVHQIYAKLGLTGDAKSKRQQLIDQWHTKP